MAIQEQNVKLVAAAVMADVPEGGGAPSSTIILDGAANAIFDDISELARAAGQVSFRKCHIIVATGDTDGLFGTNVIVSEPPKDPRVHVALFSTEETFDIRQDAVARVESYLNQGPELNGYLFENHVEGQRSIQVFQPTSAVKPTIGMVLLLASDEGQATALRQYVRATSAKTETRTYIDYSVEPPKTWYAHVTTCDISDALRYNFYGSPPDKEFKKLKKQDTGLPEGTPYTGPVLAGICVTRTTRVADAAIYYGVAPLARLANLGDIQVRASTIFNQIVPSSETEVPLANQTLSATASPMVAATVEAVTLSISNAQAYFKDRGVLQLPTGVYPGSLSGPESTTDDGKGVVKRSGIEVGEINYELGTVTFFASTGYTSTGVKSLSYIPAAMVAQQQSTWFQDVTAENRRYNWVVTLNPIPAPGMVSFAYMAQGDWYELIDNGQGVLTGADASFGAGTINYITGVLMVTTGALPDANSVVMTAWGTPSHYTPHVVSDVTAPAWTYSTSDGKPFMPESVSIAWEENGAAKGLADNGLGVLVGDGVGTVSYAKGTLAFRPESLPDPGTTPLIQYDVAPLVTEVVYPTLDVDSGLRFTLGTTPVVPNTLLLGWDSYRAPTLTERAGDATAGVSYYASAVDPVSDAALSQNTKWSRPTPEGGQSILPLYAEGGAVFKSNDLEPVDVTALQDRATLRMFREYPGVGSDTFIRVAKRLGDNGLGVLVGSSMGTVEYGTGAVVLFPKDAIRAPSWGVLASGLITTSMTNPESAITFAGAVAFQESISMALDQRCPGTSVTRNDVTTGSAGGPSTALPGTWGYELFEDFWIAGTAVQVSYVSEATIETIQVFMPSTPLELNLTPLSARQLVPGSVLFTFGGALYVDRRGILYMNPDMTSGSGIVAGSINYMTGVARLSHWVAGTNPELKLLSCLTRNGNWLTAGCSFRTAVSPIKVMSLQITATTVDGTQLSGTSDAAGVITGAKISGQVDYKFGTGTVAFGAYWGSGPDTLGNPSPSSWRTMPVDPSTVRFNAVAFSYLPLDADVIGLDPVRLPKDGKVPIFRRGEFAVVGNTQTVGPLTVSTDQVVSLGRTRVSRVRVVGHDKVVITEGYSSDLNAGEVTFTSVVGYSQPITIEHRIEDLAQISDVQLNGDITFTRPLTHDYPVTDSYVSSALIGGDLKARVSAVFDVATWNGVWSNTANSANAVATYNATLYPIVVTNAGAVSERWMLRFKTTTTFDVIGEHVGVILSGSTVSDCAPINPGTGQPYFTIDARGWGVGWEPGNGLGLITEGASVPVWVLRTIQQGPETVDDDSFTVLVRGDIDRM